MLALATLIFTACIVVIVLFIRKPEAMEKERRSKKSATNRTMDEKDKKNYNHVVPHTERNASGCNWEIFKNLVFNSPSLEQDIISLENIKKKSVSHQQKSRRKHHMLTANSSSVPQIGEEQINDESKQRLTRQVAMDCEMVGIGDGTESMIARVSIVNRHGFCVYDKYVKPREPVQDYRTEVSGIRPRDLQTGEQFDIVQKEVAEILRGRILVGHALKHDLDVLYLSHPKKHLRDTSRFKIFRQLSKGNTPSLKKLAHELLGREIQIGEHSSVEDARAAMHLYVLYRNKWESDLYSKQRMK